MKTLGDALLEYKNYFGHTWKDMALITDINESTLRDYASGRKKPGKQNTIKLQRFFSINPDGNLNEIPRASEKKQKKAKGNNTSISSTDIDNIRFAEIAEDFGYYQYEVVRAARRKLEQCGPEQVLKEFIGEPTR